MTQRPPLLWVEVLSPDDRFSRVLNGLQDCLRFGVKTIWIIDPYSNTAWTSRPEGLMQAEDGILRCAEPVLEVKLSDVLPED